MNSLYLKIFLAIISISFLGGIAIAQHSLELKKSVVFQQEPIDYYLQVDSAYLNTPHYVLWVDPVENKIIDFNIHIPFAPVSKGSFYIDENWKRYGEFILFALPKVAPNTIAYAHVDIMPNKTDLLDEWKKLSTTNKTSWEKVNHPEAEGNITFQFGPKISQAPAIESSKLNAKLIEDNWEIIIEKPDSAENFTLQFSQKHSVLFAANSSSEQQRVIIPARRLPPGELNITLMFGGEELDLLTIQNPLLTLNETDINFQKLNDTLGKFELTQLINPWVDLKDFSLKISITDFPELLMNESFAGEIPFSSHEFEENTIAILHSHKKGKQEGNQKIVVFNREAELYYNSDKEGNYFFDQYDYALLDDDYHIVSHDNFQGNINVNLNFPDIEKIQDQLPELLSQIPTRISIQSNKKSYDFSLESIGVLLDEVSISAKRKRATTTDTREKPNSVHYRNTDYVCHHLVLNCSSHEPFLGFNAQHYTGPLAVNRDPNTMKPTPLHLWVPNDNPKPNEMILKYRTSHERPVTWFTYPNTFFHSIAAKAKIKNIQEHYFREEAIFGFYSEMISQAYAPLSLLYTSEIELPGVYSNAYFIVEIIHQPTGMRQQVVKKIQ
ncbi:hypothetical protein [Peijinzhouia sedimentorum]